MQCFLQNVDWLLTKILTVKLQYLLQEFSRLEVYNN